MGNAFFDDRRFNDFCGLGSQPNLGELVMLAPRGSATLDRFVEDFNGGDIDYEFFGARDELVGVPPGGNENPNKRWVRGERRGPSDCDYVRLPGRRVDTTDKDDQPRVN